MGCLIVPVDRNVLRSDCAICLIVHLYICLIVPVGTVRRALSVAELLGSDTVSITISLERLVDLTQTMAGLVGQQLNKAVGQEKMSSDVEPGDGSGNWGGGDREPSRR